MQYRVLIVDDNATNLTLFRHLLKNINGTSSECFADAKKAMEWCQTNEPDLVLLDYMMPEMDGLEFIKLFRAIEGYKDIPLIMVTADVESQVRHQALELGAHDFLTKPVDKTEFLARTRNLLSLRKSQIELVDRAAWLAIEIKSATKELLASEKEMVLRLSKAAEHRGMQSSDKKALEAMADKLKQGIAERYKDRIADAISSTPDEQSEMDKFLKF